MSFDFSILPPHSVLDVAKNQSAPVATRRDAVESLQARLGEVAPSHRSRFIAEVVSLRAGLKMAEMTLDELAEGVGKQENIDYEERLAEIEKFFSAYDIERAIASLSDIEDRLEKLEAWMAGSVASSGIVDILKRHDGKLVEGLLEPDPRDADPAPEQETPTA